MNPDGPLVVDAELIQEEPSQAVVRIRGLVKHFRRDDGTMVPAVDDVTLDVYPGEFTVLLGPSGCGKTTLLRCIAGLEEPDSGSIEIDRRLVFSDHRRINVPPERRGISMIFQSYALWPHMTVFENIAYPLRSRKALSTGIVERVKTVVDMVGLSGLAGMYPSQLSGGQQQRTALARALVPNDKLVLFDEPLSNVDAKVREQLRLQFRAMQRELGFAAVYVTHDQVEAMELAHRIAVLDRGKLVQLGTPLEVYDSPASRYVAAFIGKANELPGTVEGIDASRVRVGTELGQVLARAPSDRGAQPGAGVILMCRPEYCRLSVEQPAGSNAWPGTLSASLFLGSHTEHLVELRGATFRVWEAGARLLQKGTPVWISVEPEQLRVLPPA